MLRPVFLAVSAGLVLAGCSALKQTGEMMRSQLVSPPVSPPDYQPGLEYLPVNSPQGPAWMVRAYADRRAGASAPVLVWYARPDLMLRTEAGRVTGVRGFAHSLQRLDASACPLVAAYPRLTRPVTCDISRDSDNSFGLRQRVRVDTPRLLTAGWDGLPGPLLLVREKPLEGDLPGSYYVFSTSGELLRSRQWIAPDFWLDLSAIEMAQGSAPAMALAAVTPAPQAAADEPAASATPAAADADPALSQPSIAPAPVAAPAPAAAPSAVPTTPQGRDVPGQPPGFVRKVR